MRLYSGSSRQFIEDTIQNRIAEKLKRAFVDYFGYNPSAQEVSSWRNSLRAMKDGVEYSELMDHGIILEYQLPQSSRRLDFMICGKDSTNTDNSVILELKQWETCEDSEIEEDVLTWTGGGYRDVLHPSVQVGRYATYLKDVHTAFYDGTRPVRLAAACYLHNYKYDPSDILFAGKFNDAVKNYPVFTMDDLDKLREFLSVRLAGGHGLEVMQRVEESKYRPSKKFMEHVSGVIKGKAEYVLLDEQLVAYDRVLTSARQAHRDGKKTAVLIRGGPGTGKSVIAINLVADLLADGYDAHYTTGSKAFTETLRRVIGSRGAVQFKYFNSYVKAKAASVDVLIADEAHRIRSNSNNRFTRKESRSTRPQIDELFDAAKVCVFFIDDDQIVRPGEVGSSELIQKTASEHGFRLHDYRLDIQFRCGGSDAFVQWITHTLRIRKTANALWEGTEDFEFRIMNSPSELEKAIRARVDEGHSARLTAGFCWDWSKPSQDGTLVNDVTIGDFRRPWNARGDSGRLAKGIPKEILWAYDPNGINQVGCVYTAQGFEFDYVGVIFGKDLVYDPDKGDWVGHQEMSKDSVVKKSGEDFAKLVKNTYRVLLSRGLKGCYVYFMDKETEKFVRSRMEQPPVYQGGNNVI